MKKNISSNSQPAEGSNTANQADKKGSGKVSRGTNPPRRTRKLKARDSERKKRYRNGDAKNEVVRFERRVLKSAIPAIVKWISDQGYFPARRKRLSKSNSGASSRPVEKPVQDRDNKTDKADDTPAAKSASETRADSAPPPSDTAKSGPIDQRLEPHISGPVIDTEWAGDGEADTPANTNVATNDVATPAEASASDLKLEYGVATRASRRKRRSRVRTQPSDANNESKATQTDLL